VRSKGIYQSEADRYLSWCMSQKRLYLLTQISIPFSQIGGRIIVERKAHRQIFLENWLYESGGNNRMVHH